MPPISDVISPTGIVIKSMPVKSLPKVNTTELYESQLDNIREQAEKLPASRRAFLFAPYSK